MNIDSVAISVDLVDQAAGESVFVSCDLIEIDSCHTVNASASVHQDG
jgi:cytochrome c2